MGKVKLYEDIYNEKFSFGKNWELYLKNLDNNKINLAKKSLLDFTKLDSFKGKTFLDFGCGSGLFSLCAMKLGAKKIISVDIDDNSLNCVKYLRKKYNNSNSKNWEVIKGSALDINFIKKLGKFDIVYSWGVLHHTGNMYLALENMTLLLKKKSLFYTAIYNDFKGFPSSRLWLKIKYFYSNSNSIIRKILDLIYVFQIILFRILRFQNPINYVKNYGVDSSRGMTFYRDVVDWLGGYPYEYATVKEIKNFYKKYDLNLINFKKMNGTGCNEFLFKNEK